MTRSARGQRCPNALTALEDEWSPVLDAVSTKKVCFGFQVGRISYPISISESHVPMRGGSFSVRVLDVGRLMGLRLLVVRPFRTSSTSLFVSVQLWARSRRIQSLCRRHGSDDVGNVNAGKQGSHRCRICILLKDLLPLESLLARTLQFPATSLGLTCERTLIEARKDNGKSLQPWGTARTYPDRYPMVKVLSWLSIKKRSSSPCRLAACRPGPQNRAMERWQSHGEGHKTLLCGSRHGR